MDQDGLDDGRQSPDEGQSPEGGQSPGEGESPEGAAEGGQAPAGAAPGAGRIQANRHRVVQIARTGGRKLFDEAAQAEFLEWFAATCNLAWSAEMAGFNYKTVLRHRMNDERFAEGWDRAVAQGYARLEAKRLETKRREAPIGIEGDRDAPEMDDMTPERADAILRERGREVKHPDMVRRQGRRPRIASNAEVRQALAGRLKAFRDRVRARRAGGAAHSEEEAPPPRCARSPSPGNPGEDQHSEEEAPPPRCARSPSPGNSGEDQEDRE